MMELVVSDGGMVIGRNEVGVKRKKERNREGGEHRQNYSLVHRWTKYK